jgi:hypothetical protein
MSKRSNKVISARGFGKKSIVLSEDDAALFGITIRALQIAIDKLAELDDSKTPDEWRDFLMAEALEDLNRSFE